MRSFLARRLAAIPLTLLGVSILVFFATAVLPGDVGRTILGPTTGTEERRNGDRQQNGDDQHDDHELDESETLFGPALEPLTKLLAH